VLLYYITDRSQFPGTPEEQQQAALSKIGEAARAGVDFIQLREKNLSGRALESLAREAVETVRKNSRPSDVKTRTRLLINSRVDVALATGADGVHLSSMDLPASEVRAIIGKTAAQDSGEVYRDFVVASSCHSAEDVAQAYAHGADFVVFGPVFEKVMPPARSGVGISVLRDVCITPESPKNVEGVPVPRLPVLALGGITLQNARECVAAGAAGIAAIRLFQENDVSELVRVLKAR